MFLFCETKKEIPSAIILYAAAWVSAASAIRVVASADLIAASDKVFMAIVCSLATFAASSPAVNC